jgi:hypothetical protein
MSTPPQDNPPSPGAWNTSVDGGRRFWLIPVATFVVGLLLGGAVIALINIASDDDSAGARNGAETSTASPTPTSTGPDSVTIPGDCIQIATDAQSLLDLVDQAVQAARDLDADALSDVVAELQTQQEALRSQASICQDAAAAENSSSTP